MFGRTLRQKTAYKAQTHAVALGLLFLFAQLLLSAHHAGGAHGFDDADHGIALECEVCTVSSGGFDVAPEVAALPSFDGFHTAFVGLNEQPVARQIARIQQPRAPPTFS